MDNYIKYLCLSLLIAATLPLYAKKTPSVHFQGEYFIYNDSSKIIFGCGKIKLATPALSFSGQILYLDTEKGHGVLYGGITHSAGVPVWDALYFRVFPLRFCLLRFTEKAEKSGSPEICTPVKKPSLKELKNCAIYYEFKSFILEENLKVRARNVIPYIMGMPSVPLKKFTLNRGRLPEKTLFYFRDINYTKTDGISISSRLHVHQGPVRGQIDLKTYERELMNLPGIKRGLLYSGHLALYSGKKKSLINLGIMGNSGDKSFGFTLSHSHQSKTFDYSISQQLSGRKNAPVFLQLSTMARLKKFRFITPEAEFRHNLKKSYSYHIRTPVQASKNLTLNLGYERRIISEGFESDQADFHSSLGFSSKLFNLSSAYSLSQDMIQSISKNNFSINLDLAPLTFLARTISLKLSPFYIYNSFPAGDGIQDSSSPGIRFQANSTGLILPFGIIVSPSFSINHIWEENTDDISDFNTILSLSRQMGYVGISLDYSLTSRYRTQGFWVEGSSTRNVNLSLSLRRPDHYDLLLRLSTDTKLAPEILTCTGKVNLPFNLNFSSFIIYYIKGERFQTIEIFLEKTFKRKLRIQGGYSLALKRFFIKFLLV